MASSLSIILFSAAILRSGRLARAAGIAGTAIGGLLLAGFFAGRLRIDVHGFGIVTFAQSTWLLWVGAMLLRGGD